MALVILDGNQSATTLSTIVVSSAHIPAHTVVSLGAQAISDIASSVSGSVVSISNFPASQTTTFGAVTGSVSVLNFPASQAVTFSAVSISNFPASQSTTFGAVTGSISVLNFPATQAISISSVTIGNSITISSVPPISGSVTLGAGNQQIGSVTASISGTIPISISSVTIGNFPATQAVTFSQASVTFGTSVITGSVSVLNIPATQTVTFSQAPVTFGLISGTVTANNSTLTNVLQYDGSHYFLKVGGVATTGGTSFPVYVAGTVTASPTGTQTIDGTVTIGAGTEQIGSVTASISGTIPISISSVTIGNSITISSLPNVKIQGFNGAGVGQYIDIGVTEQGAVAVVLDSELPAGTAQIGSVTASGTVTANIGTIQVKNYNNVITSGYFKQAVDDTLQVSGMGDDGAVLSHLSSVYGVNLSAAVGSLPISGTVTANTFAVQGTSVTTSNFTSITPSTVLANFNATREVLTIFNEGAGNLHVCAGATCTTIAYQVRLSAGDYYEVPNHQTTITHSAVFATAGTARVTQIS